jgi:hypothetical protein
LIRLTARITSLNRLIDARFLPIRGARRLAG